MEVHTQWVKNKAGRFSSLSTVFSRSMSKDHGGLDNFAKPERTETGGNYVVAFTLP